MVQKPYVPIVSFLHLDCNQDAFHNTDNLVFLGASCSPSYAELFIPSGLSCGTLLRTASKIQFSEGPLGCSCSPVSVCFLLPSPPCSCFFRKWEGLHFGCSLTSQTAMCGLSSPMLGEWNIQDSLCGDISISFSHVEMGLCHLGHSTHLLQLLDFVLP